MRLFTISCVFFAALELSPCQAASLSVTSNMPIAGSFSLEVDASGGGAAYVQQNGLALSDFVIAFDADIGSVASQSAVGVPLLSLIDTSAEPRIRYQLRIMPNSVIFIDGAETISAQVFANELAPGVHAYELAIDIATGTVDLSIDGMPLLSVVNDFSPTTQINQLRFGLTANSAQAGTMLLDNFSISVPGQPMPVFFDGFESGNTSMWSATVP